VLSNLAAMPVVSAIVMPAGLLGLAAMPFGLDAPFWRIMELGIDWMILVAQWVASLPGAVGRVTAFGAGPLLVASLGIVMLGLLRSPLRWAGALGVGVAIAWAALTPQPEVLIAGDGRQVAVRGADGRLRLMQGGADTFRLKEWLAADADSRAPDAASLRAGVSCDPDGCVTPLADGRLVALSLRPDGLADDCARAVLIITAGQPPPDCAARVIGRDELQANGALALRRSGNDPGLFVAEAARPRGQSRPWAPAAADATDAAISTEPSSRRRAPIDGTPAPQDQVSDE
jgi:competence protein ComEC